MFAFIPCETVKVSQDDQTSNILTMIQKPFLDEWNRIKKF